eukprot:GHVR01037316.1.p1 GENE.GHVR01037316.1~~GHVR01037316.1.p1  ORF type:complete len:124 (+),score=4.48 GHVR01037316.1:209-580(+)
MLASYAFSDLSKYSDKPTSSKLRTLKTVLYQLAMNEKGLLLSKLSLDEGSAEIRVWTDASYDLALHTGRTGYLIQLVDSDTNQESTINSIAWKSKAIKRKVSSTTAAELFALLQAKQCVYYKE